MDKNLRKECIDAIVEAATNAQWTSVMNLSLHDVVEQLEQSGVETPLEAVEMYAEWVEMHINYGNAR